MDCHRSRYELIPSLTYSSKIWNGKIVKFSWIKTSFNGDIFFYSTGDQKTENSELCHDNKNNKNYWKFWLIVFLSVCI